jgi:hypothetical protein
VYRKCFGERGASTAMAWLGRDQERAQTGGRAWAWEWAWDGLNYVRRPGLVVSLDVGNSIFCVTEGMR